MIKGGISVLENGLFLYLVWGTVIVSAVWYFTAFIRPGFIKKLNKTGNSLLFNMCVGISGFLRLPAVVAVYMIFFYYLRVR